MLKSRARWWKSVIPALGRLSQEDRVFQAGLSYIRSSRPVWRKILSQNKRKKKKKKEREQNVSMNVSE
jgi:hypothetical protein